MPWREDSEDTDSYELAVAVCAAFFYTSKTAMRKRLHELGLHEESRSPAVRRRLDIVDMFTQYIEDETFRSLLDAGIYRYLKGYVVRNDPKYIQGDSLTKYAREHLNECALTFRETYRKPEETTGGLLFRKDAYFSLRADYDERMKREPEAMARLKNRLEEMKTRYIGSGLFLRIGLDFFAYTVEECIRRLPDLLPVELCGGAGKKAPPLHFALDHTRTVIMEVVA